MTTIAVAAAKSSPGTSTLAELVALLAPPGRRPVLVDADPAGGDWLLRPGIAAEPGLASLAMAARRGLPPGELAAHLQHVGDGLGVLVAPAAARQATAALELVADALAVELAGVDAVVDAGTLAESSPALPLLRAADLVVLVARPTARAVVHLAPWVEELVADGRSLAVALAPLERRRRTEPAYRPAEVADALGVEVLGALPDDPEATERLWAQPGRLPAVASTRLGRAAAALSAAAFARAASSPLGVPATPVTSEVVS